MRTLGTRIKYVDWACTCTTGSVGVVCRCFVVCLDLSKKKLKSIKIILIKEKEHPIIDCLVQIEISEFTLNKSLFKIWHCLSVQRILLLVQWVDSVHVLKMSLVE